MPDPHTNRVMPHTTFVTPASGDAEKLFKTRKSTKKGEIPCDDLVSNSAMITPASQPCPGPHTRRRFLEIGSLALGGLTLENLLASRAQAGQKHPDTSVILL